MGLFAILLGGFSGVVVELYRHHNLAHGEQSSKILRHSAAWLTAGLTQVNYLY